MSPVPVEKSIKAVQAPYGGTYEPASNLIADGVDSLSVWHGPMLFFGGICVCIAGFVGIAAAFGSHVDQPIVAVIIGIVGTLLCLIVATSKLIASAIEGTIKVGHHNPDDPMCRCGICQASGRWLMRPLPPERSRHELAPWFDSITDHCTRAERDLLSGYLSDGKASTADFLAAWEAAQRPPAKQPGDPGTPMHDALLAHERRAAQPVSDCVRAAIEADYRANGIPMPTCSQREMYADALVRKGYTAEFTYDNTTGAGEYHLIKPGERCEHEYVVGSADCILCGLGRDKLFEDEIAWLKDEIITMNSLIATNVKGRTR